VPVRTDFVVLSTRSETKPGQESQADIVELILELFSRPELRMLNVILLLSFYSAAVLTTSLMLNSVFGLASGFVGAYQNPAIEDLLSSLSLQASGSYAYVEAPLIIGFVLASFLSGLPFGRKIRSTVTEMDRFGGRLTSGLGAIMPLCLFVSFSSLAISYLISFIFSAVLLYAISLAVHATYSLPLFNLNFMLFFITLTISCFVSLLVGSSITFGGTRKRGVIPKRDFRRSFKTFDTFPKRSTIGYFACLTLILLSSSFVLIVGLAQISGIEYSVSGHGIPGVEGSSPSFSSSAQNSSLLNQTLITREGSRLIYTSQVPESIAYSLDVLQPGPLPASSFPMTLSLNDANNTYPLVVRGLPTDIIQSLFGSISESNQGNDGWVILGSLAADAMKVHLGNSISVAGPLPNETINLEVIKVFTLGNEEDYQGIVPLSIGQELAGDPPGRVTAIAVSPSSGLDVGSFLRTVYRINLNYTGVAGTLYILDSLGFIHSELEVPSPIQHLLLPFGVYSIVLVHNEIRTILDQFETDTNDSTISVASNLQNSDAFLCVKNSTASAKPPALITSSNETLLPDSFDPAANCWVFQVQGGLYNLSSGAAGLTSSEELLVFGNTTYDPDFKTNGSAFLNLLVSDTSLNATENWLCVKGEQSGYIVFSSLVTSNADLRIPVVSNQSYDINILTVGSNVLLGQNVSVTSGSSTSLTFNVPNVPEVLISIPISEYSSIGVGPADNQSFLYLMHSTILSTVALFSLFLLLLGATVFALGGQVLVFLRSELQLSKFTFLTKISLTSRIHLPLLAISMLAAVMALLLSFGIFLFLGISSSVEFLGYGLDRFPFLYMIPILSVLSFLSWLRISIPQGRTKNMSSVFTNKGK
jgi:hypothetical protein